MLSQAPLGLSRISPYTGGNDGNRQDPDTRAGDERGDDLETRRVDEQNTIAHLHPHVRREVGREAVCPVPETEVGVGLALVAVNIPGKNSVSYSVLARPSLQDE